MRSATSSFGTKDPMLGDFQAYRRQIDDLPDLTLLYLGLPSNDAPQTSQAGQVLYRVINLCHYFDRVALAPRLTSDRTITRLAQRFTTPAAYPKTVASSNCDCL